MRRACARGLTMFEAPREGPRATTRKVGGQAPLSQNVKLSVGGGHAAGLRLNRTGNPSEHLRNASSRICWHHYFARFSGISLNSTRPGHVPAGELGQKEVSSRQNMASACRKYLRKNLCPVAELLLLVMFPVGSSSVIGPFSYWPFWAASEINFSFRVPSVTQGLSFPGSLCNSETCV
jgi:hypothetical protein